MPLPKPHSGESERDYVSRCMSDARLRSEFDDVAQRAAVCYGQSRSRKAADPKTGLGMRVVGPASPAEELDKADAGGENDRQLWATARDVLVGLSKRAGFSVEERDVSKTRIWRDEDGCDVELEKRDRRKRFEIRKREEVRKDVIGDDGLRSAPQTTGTDQDVDSRVHDWVDDILEPPYPSDILATLHENSGPLRRNIEAVATNVDGFGYQLEPVLDFSHPAVADHVRDLMMQEKLEDEDLETLTPEAVAAAEPAPAEVEAKLKFFRRVAMLEEARLLAWFEYLNPLKTFTKLRREMRQTLEVFGGAAWEVIRQDQTKVDSPIQQAWEVPYVSLRLIRADRKPTVTTMRIRKNSISFEDVEVHRFFRRYVRITGVSRIYYKDFGDPRIVSRRTGHYFDSLEQLREEEGEEAEPAHELRYWSHKSQVSPYGTPVWIGTLLAILGNRASEEVNFLFFDNKAIPQMVLLCSGGRLAEESVSKLESYIQERIKGRENFHKIMIIEALPATAQETAGGLEPSGKLRLEFKALGGEIQKDGLFHQYEEDNELKVGRAFRQPGLYTGDTRDQNRSTSETAKAMGEEQVYQPLRDDFDAEMDRYFLPNQGCRFWRFRTNAPVQRIPNDLVSNVEKCLNAGAISPNEGRAFLSDAFSKKLAHRPESWAQIPPRLAQAAARTGAGGEGTPTDDLRALDAMDQEDYQDEERDGGDQAGGEQGQQPAEGQQQPDRSLETPQEQAQGEPEPKRARLTPSARKRQRVARGALKAIAGLRELVQHEVDKATDEFFDPREWHKDAREDRDEDEGAR